MTITQEQAQAIPVSSLANITLWTTCFGDGYRSYVKGWFDAVLKMHPRPSHIVYVTDSPDGLILTPAQTTELMFSGIRLLVKIVPEPPTTKYPIPYYNNIAVDACTTEWVWRCDIDDRMEPWGLRHYWNLRSCGFLDDMEIDVVFGGSRNAHGTQYIPQFTDTSIIALAEFNPGIAGSGFRWRTWSKVGGYPDVAFDDWGLWRLMAKQGAKFYQPGFVTYFYDLHPETSVSGKHAGRASVQEVIAL